MPVPLLDLKAQYRTIQPEIERAMIEVAREQVFILGPRVEQFERSVESMTGASHAISCASGTDAMLLALRAVGAGVGTEVITTPFTFFATAGAIANAGATPVFADIDPDTFLISPEEIARRLTPRTAAVIAVNLFGQMAPLERIRAILPPGVALIEDSAQSIGATRIIAGQEVPSGAFSDITTFSFFPSKNLGGFGDGGLMTTNSPELALALRKLRTHGSLKTYYHEIVGFNSRLDTLQAAILSVKLPYLAGWAQARARNARYYDEILADIPGLRTPVVDTHNTSVYNQYTLRAPRRDELLAWLKGRSIGAAVYYPLPLHLQPCFAFLGYEAGSMPFSELVADEVISLPVYPELGHAALEEVSDALHEFYGSAG